MSKSSRYELQRKTPGFDWSNVASRRHSPAGFDALELGADYMSAHGEHVRVVHMRGDTVQAVVIERGGA